MRIKSLFQFSLRELLLFVLVAAIGLTALKIGGTVASLVMLLAVAVTTGIAIVAFVGRGEVRASACGFVIPVIAYTATVFAVGKGEFDPYEGKLPTSQLLSKAHVAIAESMWIDAFTHEVFPDYDPTTDPNRNFGGGLGGGGVGGGRMMTQIQSPDRPTFMSLGHVLFGLLFGYAGAKFAVAIHRSQQSAKGTSEAPS